MVDGEGPLFPLSCWGAGNPCCSLIASDSPHGLPLRHSRSRAHEKALLSLEAEGEGGADGGRPQQRQDLLS